MGPFLGSLEQVAAIRKIYVSPGITAHDDDCKTFAAKVGSALGPGNSFQMKRSAYETYDFAQDVIRLKDLSGTPDEFADLFRPKIKMMIRRAVATCGVKRSSEASPWPTPCIITRISKSGHLCE